jgi:hypothetical protein
MTFCYIAFSYLLLIRVDSHIKKEEHIEARGLTKSLIQAFEYDSSDCILRNRIQVCSHGMPGRFQGRYVSAEAMDKCWSYFGAGRIICILFILGLSWGNL